jgi:hypothetical protein
MIAWINVVVLIGATLLTPTFYVKSAGPAALEKEIGCVLTHSIRSCTVHRSVYGKMIRRFHTSRGHRGT